jgi:hypothetical protein
VNRTKVRVEIFAAGRAKAYETLALFSKVREDKMFTDFGIEPPTRLNSLARSRLE